MSVTHRVPVSEIRRWMNTICDALETGGVSQIDVDQEGYWSVFFDNAFNLSHMPEPGIGSLSDDIGDLRREVDVFHSEDRGMIVGHACEHLAGIVTYMAFTYPGVVVNASDRAGGSHA